MKIFAKKLNRRAPEGFVLLPVLAAIGIADVVADDQRASQEIFERRILPIFKSPNPSSCTECHLAGVDLKNYILPSHEKTFLSLRDQGLIDLESPTDSKILRLIAMGGGTNEGASLINAKVREAEHAAFADWIQASARDPKLRNAPKLSADDIARPARPLEVIRHARTDPIAGFIRGEHLVAAIALQLLPQPGRRGERQTRGGAWRASVMAARNCRGHDAIPARFGEHQRQTARAQPVAAQAAE